MSIANFFAKAQDRLFRVGQPTVEQITGLAAVEALHSLCQELKQVHWRLASLEKTIEKSASCCKEDEVEKKEEEKE